MDPPRLDARDLSGWTLEEDRAPAVTPHPVRFPSSSSSTAAAEATGPTVIIGAGAAGLAAAARIPGPVILLEADALVGGRALWSGGYLFLVDTPELAGLGREVTAADAVSDWPMLTGAPASDATRAYMAAASEVRDHLVDLGLTLDVGHEDPVLHRYLQHHVDGGGEVLVDALDRQLPPSVDLHLGTPAVGLVFEGARVVGVETADGMIEAGWVIIASGGFVNRADLVARFTRAPAGSWGVGADGGAWGSAIGWAQEYGLGIADPGAIGWNANVLGVPGADGTPVKADRAGVVPWIWVDRRGERYIDESAGWSLTLAAQLDAHPGTWAITSWDVLLDATDGMDHPFLIRERDSGVALRCGEDIDDLADRIGVRPTTLAATLATVYTYQQRTATDPFGRAGSSFPAFHGAPCAVRPGRLASKNYGGLDTDLDGRVLDEEGRVVPGLWAVGEAAGMASPGIGGRFGFDGSLGAVVWSGWRMGDLVAGEVYAVRGAEEDDTGG